jgi:hypothetical protein
VSGGRVHSGGSFNLNPFVPTTNEDDGNSSVGKIKHEQKEDKNIQVRIYKFAKFTDFRKTICV